MNVLFSTSNSNELSSAFHQFLNTSNYVLELENEILSDSLEATFTHF